MREIVREAVVEVRTLLVRHQVAMKVTEDVLSDAWHVIREARRTLARSSGMISMVCLQPTSVKPEPTFGCRHPVGESGVPSRRVPHPPEGKSALLADTSTPAEPSTV
jgi:hypothetical protein